MAAIHHATVKRATRQGLTIDDSTGQFVLVRNYDQFRSDPYDSTAEALEEFERGETEFFDPSKEEGGTQSGSVVKPRYHTEYSKNPHGPGCGDTLDISLRNAVMHIPEGEKEPRVNLQELRSIGIHNDLWMGGWELLNPGMQRMNLSNRLRAYLRNHEEGTVWLGSEGEGRFGVPYQPARSRKQKAA